MRRYAPTTSLDVQAEHQQPQRSAMRDSLPIGSGADRAEVDADSIADRAMTVASDYGSPTARRATRDRGFDGLRVDRSALDSAAGSGQPLDAAARDRLEPGLGADLSSVRVHTGSSAARLATDMGAAAFTSGKDIFFGGGRYEPGTTRGDHLIAHEAAHTMQDDSSIHRFSEEVLSTPQMWANITGGVFRPGEGLSGGVYILSPKVAGPIKKVVAKPIFGENGAGAKEVGAQLTLADEMIQKVFGVKTPKSRVVNAGTPEFSQLLSVCSPKQPQRPGPDEDGHNSWRPLAEAASFVVMSEVPEGKSIGGLAAKSGTDVSSAQELGRTIFDAKFLGDLGRLGVADLLLGNSDRLMYGALNLGNIMVSVQNGERQLHAIDTAAALPKATTPSLLVMKGNARNDLTTNTKEQLDTSPAMHCDRFFNGLLEQMEKHGPKDVDPETTPWKLIGDWYRTHRAKYVEHFERGWHEAMAEVYLLAGTGGEHSGNTKDMTERHDSEESSHDTLLAQAGYMRDRWFGDDHATAAANNASVLAAQYARTVDRTKMAAPPTGGALGHNVLTTPPNATLTAANPAVPAVLGKPGKLKDAVPAGYRAPLKSAGIALREKTETDVVRAHNEIDKTVASTVQGKRSFGLVGKRKVTANHDLPASHFVVNAIAASVGAGRVTDATTHAFLIADEIKSWTFPIQANDRPAVVSLINDTNRAVDDQMVLLEAYSGVLAQAIAGAPSLLNYGDLAGLNELMSKAHGALQNRKNLGIPAIEKMKLREKVGQLTASNK